jgi:glutaredoxin 2
MAEAQTSPFVDSQGRPLELTLYKYNSCPFCIRVMLQAKALGLDLPMRDTRNEPQARTELVQLGGKSQVPCLIINGEPMYESADIVRFLKTVRVAA